MTYTNQAVRFVFAIILLQTSISPSLSSEPVSPSKMMLQDIRDCMGDIPAPWSEAWQQEYLETIRHSLTTHQDTSRYEQKLKILKHGFRPYWEGLKKSPSRSLFEVQCAQIKWYIEALMETGPNKKEKQTLCKQWQTLWEFAASSLVTQFTFLDPNIVHKATREHLHECLEHVEVPLEPIYQHPLSGDQVKQIKQGWHGMRYARVDLMCQLGGETVFLADRPCTGTLTVHPHYLLAQRSFGQLLSFVWFVAANPPAYYRSALKHQAEAKRKHRKLISQHRAEENRLRQERSRQVDQTEYLSFLFAVLLEPPPCFQTLMTSDPGGRTYFITDKVQPKGVIPMR